MTLYFKGPLVLRKNVIVGCPSQEGCDPDDPTTQSHAGNPSSHQQRAYSWKADPHCDQQEEGCQIA